MSVRAKELYREITGRKYIYLVLLTAALLLMLFIDVSVGPARLLIKEVYQSIFLPSSATPATRVIVWLIRLPVALMAIVVGASLAVSGAEMQTILDNPLASPYTLGVSAGAGFGAALAMVLGVGVIPYGQEFLVPVNAFFFSMLSCFLVYFIGKAKGVSKGTMILTGIAILFLFHAALALLQYLASEEELQSVVFWLFGSLMKATWMKLGVTVAVLFIVLTLLVRENWKLTALRLGDETAMGLGINTERLRLKVFLLCSILSAAAVCFVGIIGFIGLAGPHIARMLVGEDQRFFLPTSALAGAVILSTSSVISKSVIPGAVFPIGIVTSFIGVPFFLLLILGKRRSHW